MQKIKKYVDQIREELDGAEEYVEKYIENKLEGKNDRALLYKQLAQDEIRHSDVIHKIALEDIEQLNSIYNPSSEMLATWDKAHIEFVNKYKWIESLINA